MGIALRASRTTAARSASAALPQQAVERARLSRCDSSHASASRSGSKSMAMKSPPFSRRDLQDRGTGQSSMGEEELLAKAAAVARHFGVQRDAREIAEARERSGSKERGTRAGLGGTTSRPNCSAMR